MNQYATYSPEDDKLRLYVGRVPRDEYFALKAEGWTSTPKQSCDFVAVWTVSRYQTALKYGDGIVEDEDQSPEERAADRAERFGGYRDKRLSEATGRLDSYNAEPMVHGYQSQARADRAAARHDRIANRALTAWDKAEYWTRRTAGVINHALHKSSPGVRMGRIKTIEAELRKHNANVEEQGKFFRHWVKISTMENAEEQTKHAINLSGYSHGHHYHHPRPESESAYTREHGNSLYSLLTQENDPITGAEAAALYLAGKVDPSSPEWENTGSAEYRRHLELRLAYENQMLQAQGGRAAFVEMEVGGFIGGHQIRKVNKSPKTGRVVSVTLKTPGRNAWDRDHKPGDFHLRAFNIERLPAGAYTPPTDADKASLVETKKEEKASAPKKRECPLINPTDDDAQRLQDILNAEQKAEYDKQSHYTPFTPSEVLKLTQAQWGQVSKGYRSSYETREVRRCGVLAQSRNNDMYSSRESERARTFGAPVCKVRFAPGKYNGNFCIARRVVILTDKPQKSLPVSIFEPRTVAVEAAI